MKLVRSDVQNQKSQVIGAALELSASEGAAFWFCTSDRRRHVLV